VCIRGASYALHRFFTQGSLSLLIVYPLWFICVLAETMRAPFDLGEAESELVSGFNTEFSGPSFAFFFLAEYGVMICSCLFIAVTFLGWALGPNPFLLVGVVLATSGGRI